MSEVQASIIIVTINRSEALFLLLEELTWQDFSSFEVVVVIGPTEDDTKERIKSFEQFVKVVHCNAANISLARNVGAAAASGEVLVYIDDDAYPTDGQWLSRYVDHLEDPQHLEKTGVVGGEVLISNSSYPEFENGVFNRDGFQVFQNDGQSNATPGVWIPRVAGGNHAFRREVFEKIGGYDENISYYLDETDFCCRLFDVGYRIDWVKNSIRHYRYPSSVRKNSRIVDRYQIAKSDFYFCLQNSLHFKILTFFLTWISLPRKHYFREIFSKDESYKLGIIDTFKTICSVFKGAIAGSVVGWRRRKKNRLFETAPEFRKFDREVVRELAFEHIWFRNNPMGEGGSSFRAIEHSNQIFQVYWSHENFGFTEAQNLNVSFPRGRKSHLDFSKKTAKSITRLRIDPMNRSGRVKYLSICLTDEKQNPILEWNLSDWGKVKESNDIQMCNLSEIGDVELICETNDPWFALDVPAHQTSSYRLTVKLLVADLEEYNQL